MLEKEERVMPRSGTTQGKRQSGDVSLQTHRKQLTKGWRENCSRDKVEHGEDKGKKERTLGERV